MKQSSKSAKAIVLASFLGLAAFVVNEVKALSVSSKASHLANLLQTKGEYSRRDLCYMHKTKLGNETVIAGYSDFPPGANADCKASWKKSGNTLYVWTYHNSNNSPSIVIRDLDANGLSNKHVTRNLDYVGIVHDNDEFIDYMHEKSERRVPTLLARARYEKYLDTLTTSLEKKGK